MVTAFIGTVLYMYIHLGSYGSIDSSQPSICGSVGGGSYEGVEDWEYMRYPSTSTTISTEGIYLKLI